ncbi:unnamed protein product [Enterobius vermicularis]|uniref:Thyroglobulin type-1 domain-containing protein n=1 Tax=Enterobius vermicularis TaxID=51028 RepID=A0A0N4VKD5_ENTVE|nr:unnamed protein product [Enterobius vermicularis]
MLMSDPVPGSLGGRSIYWCPGGQGNTAYCPRPTDPDGYIYCCTHGYDITIPSCCRFSTFTGLIYAYYFSAVIAIANKKEKLCK